MPATSSSKNTSSSSRGKRPRTTATGATSSSKSPRAKAHGATSSSSRGQSLKITKNEVEAVKASLLKKVNYGVLNLEQRVRLQPSWYGNDFLPTILLSQLITQASHIILKTRPLPGLGLFEGQFFFPIVLDMTTKPVNFTKTSTLATLFETNLIASTGIEIPHDTGATSIHNFHRLLNTAYPDKYKKAVKTLHKIITDASKDLNWWYRGVDTELIPSANTPQLPISISIAWSAAEITAQLTRHYGMHIFMVNGGDPYYIYGFRGRYFAGIMVKW